MYFKFRYFTDGCCDYTITLKNHQLSMKSYFVPSFKRTIDAQKATQFWDQVKAIQLETWKDSYNNSNLCDGVQWGVKVRTDFLIKKIEGSNDYPDGVFFVEETPIFNQLIDAVAFLLDDKNFLKDVEEEE